MASIIRRGVGQYQAQVAKVSPLTGKTVRRVKTFETEKEAENWAIRTEAEILNGKYNDTRDLEGVSVESIIQRYLKEVTPRKVGARQESVRLRKWLTHEWASYPIHKLHQSEVIQYIADRRNTISIRGTPVSEQTIKHELIVLSNVYEFAIAHGYDIANPIKKIGKVNRPGGSREVYVRILPEQQEMLLEELGKCRNRFYPIITELAIESLMRQGEIFRLRPKDIKLDKKHLIATDYQNKNNVITEVKRVVPLSARAMQLLEFTKDIKDRSESIWGVTSADGLSRAFTAACKKIEGLESATFHSTRHEGASRLAKHLPIQQLQKIMGQKTISMLQRYYNPTADDLVEAINNIPKQPVKKIKAKKAIAA